MPFDIYLYFHVILGHRYIRTRDNQSRYHIESITFRTCNAAMLGRHINAAQK